MIGEILRKMGALTVVYDDAPFSDVAASLAWQFSVPKMGDADEMRVFEEAPDTSLRGVGAILVDCFWDELYRWHGFRDTNFSAADFAVHRERFLQYLYACYRNKDMGSGFFKLLSLLAQAFYQSNQGDTVCFLYFEESLHPLLAVALFNPLRNIVYNKRVILHTRLPLLLDRIDPINSNEALLWIYGDSTDEPPIVRKILTKENDFLGDVVSDISDYAKYRLLDLLPSDREQCPAFFEPFLCVLSRDEAYYCFPLETGQIGRYRYRGRGDVRALLEAWEGADVRFKGGNRWYLSFEKMTLLQSVLPVWDYEVRGGSIKTEVGT